MPLVGYREHYVEAVQPTHLARYCPLEVCILVLLQCMWPVTGYLNLSAKYTAMFTTWYSVVHGLFITTIVLILSSSEQFSLCDKFLPQPEIRTFWCYDHEMEREKASSHREFNPARTPGLTFQCSITDLLIIASQPLQSPQSLQRFTKCLSNHPVHQNSTRKWVVQRSTAMVVWVTWTNSMEYVHIDAMVVPLHLVKSPTKVCIRTW